MDGWMDGWMNEWMNESRKEQGQEVVASTCYIALLSLVCCFIFCRWSQHCLKAMNGWVMRIKRTNERTDEGMDGTQSMEQPMKQNEWIRFNQRRTHVSDLSFVIGKIEVLLLSLLADGWPLVLPASGMQELRLVSFGYFNGICWNMFSCHDMPCHVCWHVRRSMMFQILLYDSIQDSRGKSVAFREWMDACCGHTFWIKHGLWCWSHSTEKSSICVLSDCSSHQPMFRIWAGCFGCLHALDTIRCSLPVLLPGIMQIKQDVRWRIVTWSHQEMEKIECNQKPRKIERGEKPRKIESDRKPRKIECNQNEPAETEKLGYWLDWFSIGCIAQDVRHHSDCIVCSYSVLDAIKSCLSLITSTSCRLVWLSTHDHKRLYWVYEVWQIEAFIMSIFSAGTSLTHAHALAYALAHA